MLESQDQEREIHQSINLNKPKFMNRSNSANQARGNIRNQNDLTLSMINNNNI